MSTYLGIDTSNYTTSFAVCGDEDYSVRKILEVPEGARGVRQSDGVFLHLKNAPALFKELCENVDVSKISAVGVSVRPRNVEGSYMPVFVPGTTFAELVSKTLNVPLYTFSHQDGHIMAGIESSGSNDLLNGEFYSVHLSGGTCEILKTNYTNHQFQCKICGGTLDISAGQLIDRTGVAAGMQFPCGREITGYAMLCDEKPYPLSVSVKDGYINFSGAEAQVKRIVGGDYDKYRLSRSVLDCIGESLVKALSAVRADNVLMVGGVSASEYLKKYMTENSKNIKFIFASPEFATDNAWGIAKLVQRRSEYGT